MRHNPHRNTDEHDTWREFERFDGTPPDGHDGPTVSRRDFLRSLAKLSTVGVLGAALAACGGLKGPSSPNAPGQSGPEGTSAVSGDATMPPALATSSGIAPSDLVTYPLTNKKVSFDLIVSSDGDVRDFSTNDFTQWYEARTGVHINWNVVPSIAAQRKLTVLLAAGEYPDIIMSYHLDPYLQQLYGSSGGLLAMNSYIDKHGTYLRQVFKAYPYARKLISANDGKIYALPSINDCYSCNRSQKLWIYRLWLDKLGLEMPRTTDELERALEAFKNKDPNGNGEADELPLSGARDVQNGSLDQFFMNSFLDYNPGQPWLTVLDGKITPAYNQPGWKDGLKYLHKLYGQGLIDPNSFAQGKDQLQSIANRSGAPVLGSVPASDRGQFVRIDPSNEGRWTEYTTVPALKGPQGVRVAAWYPYGSVLGGEFILTKGCKQPELAFRWADGLYDAETTLRSTEGVPGRDWRWAKPGEEGIDGEQAVWARISGENSSGGLFSQNSSWMGTGPSFRSGKVNLGRVPAGKWDPDLLLYEETKRNYAPYAQDISRVMPTIYFEGDQAREIGEMEADIVRYVSSTFVEFVTGKTDVDTGWGEYINTLEDKHLSRYLEIYQSAYDKKYG